MAKAIMIQGTMSNAGKSLLAAGLCRVLVRRGYKVAPFKAQNMALNSYITEDGSEIGRAQAVQAFAAGRKPHVNMNPVLLKPTTDMGSQVIVMGKALENMSAQEYYARKHTLTDTVKAAYDELARDNDIIVIEGAGSPVEINLGKDDFVNMGMAHLADAKVLLVGDIDRGGVFAQLYGTMELLAPEEKDRVLGLIVNKFRGDISILKSGIDDLERLCGKPVLGILPYLNVDIEEEDSLSGRFERNEENVDMRCIDIAVIRLGRLSNYTDFMPLEMEYDTRVRYVSSPEQFKDPDICIIPGTKSTIEDLKWLRQSGLEAVIKRYASKGGLVTGICGGYQMLGKSVTDLCRAESDEAQQIDGLGLLDIRTTFSRSKLTRQVEGRIEDLEGDFHELSGMVYRGYEIHCGQSDALFTADENVFGTYVHGLFEDEKIRDTFLEIISRKKGVLREVAREKMTYEQYRDMQFEILADAVEEAVDIDGILKAL